MAVAGDLARRLASPSQSWRLEIFGEDAHLKKLEIGDWRLGLRPAGEEKGFYEPQLLIQIHPLFLYILVTKLGILVTYEWCDNPMGHFISHQH